MRLSRRRQVVVTSVLISISFLAWVLLFVIPGHPTHSGHHHGHGPVNSMQFGLALDHLLLPIFHWGLMVVAMMLPKLIVPIAFIYTRSFKQYAPWCSLLFVLGYMMMWLIVGIPMLFLIEWVKSLLPMSYMPALVMLVIALVWQFSPWKQLFLNLGHGHRTISAFGWAAGRDSLIFGLIHGAWCIGSGWALMILPMLLPQGHYLAMLVVAFIMLSEHLENPRYPQWYFSPRLKLLKLFVAKTRIRFRVLYARGS